MRLTMGCFLAAGLVGSIATAEPARAQEEAAAAAAAPALLVELNAMQPIDNGCRFTFLTRNGLGGQLESAAFELVLFDKAGLVSRLTIVDFKDLPDGKTKVRQFDFAGIDCADVSRVLVNDATQCVGDGIEPEACIAHLKTETRSQTEFGT
jgi:hypothetical protein